MKIILEKADAPDFEYAWELFNAMNVGEYGRDLLIILLAFAQFGEIADWEGVYKYRNEIIDDIRQVILKHEDIMWKEQEAAKQ